MDVLNLPKSDRTSSVEADLVCEMCLRSYQRRDLLMRHRRRCRGTRKSTTRRRACDACVQAKAKCCYTQPICSRCASRGTQCVYPTSLATSIPDHLERRNEAVDTPNSSLRPSSPRMGSLATSSQPFDLELPAWDFSVSSYPFETFDMALEDSTTPPLVTLPDFTTIQPSMSHESSEFMPFDQAVSLSPVSRGILAHAVPEASLSNSASSASTPPLSLTSLAVVHVLSKYPSLLMKGSFLSPFLHLSLYSLYSKAVPDMTFLPLTSMAICCSSGINISGDNRFFRRAMDAARQRVIGGFPSYHCMQKWDALHAMLIYESLELRETISDESEAWKHCARVKGLGSPFLLKMTESYSLAYPELQNPDTSVFSDPKSSPCSVATTMWARWRITETARRTIFFVNILNFHSNRDHGTGRQLPYYEPLNDELILNMPLPCSQAAWVARSEEDWRLAMERDPPTTAHTLPEVLSSEVILKTIFSKFTKEELQVQIGTSFGFGDSDELRRLIVLCASEQFA